MDEVVDGDERTTICMSTSASLQSRLGSRRISASTVKVSKRNAVMLEPEKVTADNLLDDLPTIAYHDSSSQCPPLSIWGTRYTKKLAINQIICEREDNKFTYP
jgi:hypothetical protein